MRSFCGSKRCWSLSGSLATTPIIGGAYTRHLDPDVHSPGKRNTQKIERKRLTLRTRIKRLARKTICFSKTVQMHDIVIGLFVNRYAFGRAV
jgi:insertion element IS1 protein InsB